MSSKRLKPAWLPGPAAALAPIACYGTLAVVAFSVALNVATSFDAALRAGAIAAFAGIAESGPAVGCSRRCLAWRLLIGGLNAAAIGYAIYGQYARSIALAGFVPRCVAAVRDWRLWRIRQPGSRMAK